MPTVMRVGPYRLFFFSNEGREPPHIHVKAGSVEAKVWLNSLEIAANYGFNSRQLNNSGDCRRKPRRLVGGME
jgi:hypothetical protein